MSFEMTITAFSLAAIIIYTITTIACFLYDRHRDKRDEREYGWRNVVKQPKLNKTDLE
jgi:hypothetical protein